MKLISITLHLQKMNEDLKILSQQIRRDILRMVHSANSGHPGGSLGCVEFFVILYKKVLKNDGFVYDIKGFYKDLEFHRL